MDPSATLAFLNNETQVRFVQWDGVADVPSSAARLTLIVILGQTSERLIRLSPILLCEMTPDVTSGV